jgi:quinol monooxygenase YgiN
VASIILALLEVLFQAFVETLLRPVREEHLMTTMFVRHTVSDYKTWRKAYDDFAPVQKAKGVTAEAVYRAVENPNDITVTHEFATIEAAQAFAASAEFKNAMQNAGVAGAPTIWFTNKA